MVIVEELGDLEDPSHGIVAIEMRDVKFDVVAGRRGKRVVGVRAGVKVEGVGVRVTGATTTLVWSRGVRRGHDGSGLDREPPLPSDRWSWSKCCALPWGRR